MSIAGSCPFCVRIECGEVQASHGSAVSFADAFPISPGHSLVVPRRHVAGFFTLTPQEQDDVWTLVSMIRERLGQTLVPQGFNIGLNDGEAAGQTIGHAHVHVVPRYRGDVYDPRGGVRWIFPSKAKYWTD